MAKKKDLAGAIIRGADAFFSVNDVHEVDEAQEGGEAAQVQLELEAREAPQLQDVHEAKQDEQAREMREAQEAREVEQAREAQDAREAYRAQDVSKEDLASAICEMQDKLDAAEARRTQGRKGYRMPRISISLTPSGMDYVKIMAGITGKSITQYISDLVDRDAAANAERYKKAREIMSDGR